MPSQSQNSHPFRLLAFTALTRVRLLGWLAVGLTVSWVLSEPGWSQVPASQPPVPTAQAPAPVRTSPPVPAPTGQPAASARTSPPAARGPDPNATSRPGSSGAPLVSTAEVPLPKQAGQAWRTYDITPFTTHAGGEKPQQAVVDWVLRETGNQVWFGEPLGILSVTKDKLRVYHTEEVQRRVANIVERLNASRSRPQSVQLRLCTIANPNWRTKALRILTPVPAQTPGVDAWLLSKEDASMLIGELRRRTDYREHNSPNLQIPNGKDQTVTKTQPRTYARSLRPHDVFGVETIKGVINEGYTLRINPLMASDGQTMDAVIQCQVDQVEKLVAIPIDYSVPGGTQRAQVEVPQLVSWRLHERFRWRTNQVLLLSCGVVAQPQAPKANSFRIGSLAVPLPDVPLPGMQSQRADALLFVEVNSTFSRADDQLRSAAQPAGPSNGRY